MTEQTVLTRRDVAHLAREFGAEHDLEGFGTRGRVSKNLVLWYLEGQEAKTVRQIAEDLGVTVSPKGKISEAEYLALVEFVAGNKPKETEQEEEAE